jgi:hypothetical protein
MLKLILWLGWFSLLCTFVASLETEELVRLVEPEDRGTIVDDRYYVLIKDGSKLSEHWEKLGKDLSQDDACQAYYAFQSFDAYICTITDSTLLDEIRKDTDNVEGVYRETSEPFNDTVPEDQSGEHQLTERWEKDQSRVGPWWVQQMTAGVKLFLLPDQEKYPHMKDPMPGAGVKVYVLDSGVNLDHELFYSGPAQKQPHRGLNFRLGLDDLSRLAGKEPEDPRELDMVRHPRTQCTYKLT